MSRSSSGSCSWVPWWLELACRASFLTKRKHCQKSSIPGWKCRQNSSVSPGIDAKNLPYLNENTGKILPYHQKSMLKIFHTTRDFFCQWNQGALHLRLSMSTSMLMRNLPSQVRMSLKTAKQLYTRKKNALSQHIEDIQRLLNDQSVGIKRLE